MQSYRRFVAFALIFSLSFAAAQPPNKRPSEEEDPKAKVGKKAIDIEAETPAGNAPPKGVLVVAVPQLPELMSPTFARTDAERASLDLLFEPLVRPVYDKQIGRGYEPALAAELPRLTIRGREVRLADATWSDGTAVTSADVRATLDKLRARQSAEADTIESIVADRPDHCRIVFHSVPADPLTFLTFKLLPASHADDEAFARKPIGSGPFTFAGRRSDGKRNYVVFKANAAHGRRVPNSPLLSEVWMVKSDRPADDCAAGVAQFALTERTPDLVKQLKPAAPPANGARLEVVFGKGRLGALPSRRIYYLAVNHRHVPDAALRAVIGHAIPREEILTAVFREGYSDHHRALDGPFPPGTWPCSSLAGRLDDVGLARAKANERQKPSVTLSLKYSADDPLAERACEKIKEAFDRESFGVTLRTEPVAAERFVANIERGTDFHLAYRCHDYADEWFNPAELLGPRARAYMAYSPSIEFDRLLARVEARRDFGQLKKAMEDLHKQFNHEMPFVPLWSLDVHALTDSRLRTDPPAVLLDPLAPFAKIANWSLK